MENVKKALRNLTQKICRFLQEQEIPTRPMWTLGLQKDRSVNIAMDPERTSIPDLRFSINVGLLNMPEYRMTAAAIAKNSKFMNGIIIDDGGNLIPPEETNITRAFVMNFIWLFIEEGTNLVWNERRFDDKFEQLIAEVDSRQLVSHTSMPLSNIKMEIDSLDFDEDLRLEPASVAELESWLNPDMGLSPAGASGPTWGISYIDRPAVMHARKYISGQPRPTDHVGMYFKQPDANYGTVITALRLVLNAPVSIIFQDHRNEGLMAFGGQSKVFGGLPPPRTPLVILNTERAALVTQIWQTLQFSPNSETLTLPLRRWESSLARRTLEDKLIDIWISLESLLLGGVGGELSYRVSIRLAQFVGTNGAERSEIFDQARLSYDWRSAIVHGSSTKKLTKKLPLGETVQITPDRLRSALLKVLLSPGKFNPNKLESDLLLKDA